MKERDVVRIILDAARRAGRAGKPVWAAKLHGSPYQQVGLPDILMVVAGRAVFIEAKSSRGTVTPIQAAVHKALKRAGAVVLIARPAEWPGGRSGVILAPTGGSESGADAACS